MSVSGMTRAVVDRAPVKNSIGRQEATIRGVPTQLPAAGEAVNERVKKRLDLSDPAAFSVLRRRFHMAVEAENLSNLIEEEAEQPNIGIKEFHKVASIFPFMIR